MRVTVSTLNTLVSITISLAVPCRVSRNIFRLNHDFHLAKAASAAGLVLAREGKTA